MKPSKVRLSLSSGSHADRLSTTALAKRKAETLLTESAGNLLFSEFGTRRRRSYRIHEAVVKGLIEGDKYWATTDDGNRVLSENGGKKSGGLAGTSNVSVCLRIPRFRADRPSPGLLGNAVRVATCGNNCS